MDQATQVGTATQLSHRLDTHVLFLATKLWVVFSPAKMYHWKHWLCSFGLWFSKRGLWFAVDLKLIQPQTYFPFPFLSVCTHARSREHTHLGKHWSRSHITRVTSTCSFVAYMENSCFSFMSTYRFHCCFENSYLNGNWNSQSKELINLPNIPHYSFVPTRGYKKTI